MDAIAHRGLAAEYPENTLAAFTHASARVTDPDSTVTAIEFDVRRCGSGDLIVFHDETLDRVTDKSGPLTDYTAADLRDVSVCESAEHVPTLVEALEVIPQHVPLQVELKEAGLAADALVALADRRPAVRFTSFNPQILAEVRACDATIPLGHAFEGDVDAALAVATTYECVSVHPRSDLCVRTAVVATAHEAGFEVIAWDVTSRDAARTLAERGVDGFTADHEQFAGPFG